MNPRHTSWIRGCGRYSAMRRTTSAAVTSALSDSPLGSMVPADSVGFAVVALYLGMEMLTHLDGNLAPATELFDQAIQLTTLLGAIGLARGSETAKGEVRT